MFSAKDSTRSVSLSCTCAKKPRPVGVDLCSDGIFVDGARIGPLATATVFVVFGDATVAPILLDSAELELLSLGRIDHFPETDVWKSKMVDVLNQKTASP